ncbi:MAG: D-aminoacyl-tRNA deacylase [Elusimicrobiota bacterium]
MRLVLQRVLKAAVRLPGGEVRAVGPGLAVLVGVGKGDDEALARRMAEKTAGLRVFSNPEGRFDLSLLEVRGAALVVSQFTLFGDCSKGRRPDFTSAMEPEKAKPVYEAYAAALAGLGVEVRTGEFGAAMEVELINDGPVTIWMDSSKP